MAEGSKTTGHATFANTNLELTKFYFRLARTFFRSEVNIQDLSKREGRLPQQTVNMGGLCLKDLLLNAIEGILKHLGDFSNLGEQTRLLGLASLNGCSAGDGGVSRTKQPKTPK